MSHYQHILVYPTRAQSPFSDRGSSHAAYPMARGSFGERTLPSAARHRHGNVRAAWRPWLTVGLVSMTCCTHVVAMCALPTSSGGDSAAGRARLCGNVGLLREGIVGATPVENDVGDAAIAEAAQQLRISRVRPPVCRVPTEAVPLVVEDISPEKLAEEPSSHLKPAPDLGFVMAKQEEPQRDANLPTRERTPWCGSEAGYRNESPRRGGLLTAMGTPMRSQQESDGGWRWGGGGVGGSPIKRGAVAAVADLGESPCPRPKTCSRAVASSSTSGSYSAVVAAGAAAVAGRLAAAARLGLWSISQQTGASKETCRQQKRPVGSKRALPTKRPAGNKRALPTKSLFCLDPSRVEELSAALLAGGSALLTRARHYISNTRSFLYQQRSVTVEQFSNDQ